MAKTRSHRRLVVVVIGWASWRSQRATASHGPRKKEVAVGIELCEEERCHHGTDLQVYGDVVAGSREICNYWRFAT